MQLDVVLKEYLEQKIPELSGKIFPVFVSDLSDLSVAYALKPISGGHVKESQLELKILHEDYDTCKRVGEKICSVLDMEEDATFVVFHGIRFVSHLSGGGVLYDDGFQKFENTIYFTIDWRYAN